ncbi:hypothetical protein Glove_130g107 [Diversispora epigaea]|uniref:Uncharacterized protein n=1 Tax=Diversispora epigaea TaxID=1348612 RepID=A0A397IYC0_9GLOM|nr:hypothetical protein Glove_130g107 [Diversispora epigaea]
MLWIVDVKAWRIKTGGNLRSYGYLDHGDALCNRPGKRNNIHFSRNSIYIYSKKISPTPISATADQNIKKLEKAILALNNDINRMRTESKWKSEAWCSYRSEYSDETETLWVKFTILFDERRKREKHSPTKIYNVLSDLSLTTLAKFYRHQKSPQMTSSKLGSREKERKKITPLRLAALMRSNGMEPPFLQLANNDNDNVAKMIFPDSLKAHLELRDVWYSVNEDIVLCDVPTEFEKHIERVVLDDDDRISDEFYHNSSNNKFMREEYRACLVRIIGLGGRSIVGATRS